MGMAAPESISTIDDLLRLPDDGKRHELLDGVHVVTPAPRPVHQLVVANLLQLLGRALGARPDLTAYPSPADITLGPRTLVQPGVFVLHHVGGPPCDMVRSRCAGSGD